MIYWLCACPGILVLGTKDIAMRFNNDTSSAAPNIVHFCRSTFNTNIYIDGVLRVLNKGTLCSNKMSSSEIGSSWKNSHVHFLLGFFRSQLTSCIYTILHFLAIWTQLYKLWSISSLIHLTKCDKTYFTHIADTQQKHVWIIEYCKQIWKEHACRTVNNYYICKELVALPQYKQNE